METTDRLITNAEDWDIEQMRKGAYCIYSDKFQYNIMVNPNGKIEHIEDVKNGSSLKSPRVIQQQIDRLTALQQTIIKEQLTWDK